jgi:hypothetical protein
LRAKGSGCLIHFGSLATLRTEWWAKKESRSFSRTVLLVNGNESITNDCATEVSSLLLN